MVWLQILGYPEYKIGKFRCFCRSFQTDNVTFFLGFCATFMRIHCEIGSTCILKIWVFSSICKCRSPHRRLKSSMLKVLCLQIHRMILTVVLIKQALCLSGSNVSTEYWEAEIGVSLSFCYPSHGEGFWFWFTSFQERWTRSVMRKSSIEE